MSAATKARRRRGERATRRLARAPHQVSPLRRRSLLTAVLVTLVASALYLAVIRDLASFSVDSVQLSGASSGYGPRLRTELEAAARGMTTLHVDEARLEEIAGRYPAVVSIAVHADFPHRLSVRVSERPPVGTVEGPRGRVPVAADGSLLEGQPVDRPLPTLPGRASSGRRAKRAATAAAARLVATAPKPLAAWLRQVRRDSEGWTVGLRDGPELRFGSLADLSAKWEAATAVLRSRAARGARYLDLRLPDRPAAGGFASRPPSAPDAAAAGGSRSAETPAEDPQPQIDTSSIP
jgi:cell division protein FtsQ